MRIGELSARTGVPERLLRYYEEQGLLWPTRQPSGYREFLESDVDTVRRIRRLLGAGLSTATIGVVLPCIRERAGTLVPICPEVMDDLHLQRDRITGAIEELEAAREMLDAIISAAPVEMAGVRDH